MVEAAGIESDTVGRNALPRHFSKEWLQFAIDNDIRLMLLAQVPPWVP
jgi:hypothetical protein